MKTALSLLPAVGLLVLSACSTTPQMTNRPNFLSSYDHLKQVDQLNWRYVSPGLLGRCNRFIVSPVKILFNEVDGKPITAEQRDAAANYIRNAVISQVSGTYPVVMEPGPDVGEIRIALTEAYKTGGKLGLSVQGEILDNSNTQVAAVMRTEISELFSPGWETRDTAKTMVGNWAERLKKVIDEAHGK